MRKLSLDKIFAIICLIVILFVGLGQRVQALDPDAYLNRFMAPRGNERTRIIERKSRGQYNNEASKRQRTDDKYWNDIRRENQNRILDRMEQRSIQRKLERRRPRFGVKPY